MFLIPDGELQRWLTEDVPYGDLTTHALGFGQRPGRIRFTARQAMVAACSEEASRLMAMAGAKVTAERPVGPCRGRPRVGAARRLEGEPDPAGDGRRDRRQCARH